MSRAAWVAVVVGGAWLAAGCGGGGVTDARGSGARDALEDIGQMLTSLAEENRRPPAKQAELNAVEPMIPVAAPHLRGGDVVYVWGAGLQPGGTAVVAYEKKTEAEGGWVLLQDGTVREMTADEFRAAPRAKK